MIKTIITIILAVIGIIILWKPFFPSPIETKEVSTAIDAYIMASMKPADFGVKQGYSDWKITKTVIQDLTESEGIISKAVVKVSGWYIPDAAAQDNEARKFSKKMSFYLKQSGERIIVKNHIPLPF